MCGGRIKIKEKRKYQREKEYNVFLYLFYEGDKMSHSRGRNVPKLDQSGDKMSLFSKGRGQNVLLLSLSVFPRNHPIFVNLLGDNPLHFHLGDLTSIMYFGPVNPIPETLRFDLVVTFPDEETRTFKVL